MNDLITGLRSDGKLQALKAFNAQYSDFSFQNVSVDVIEGMLLVNVSSHCSVNVH